MPVAGPSRSTGRVTSQSSKAGDLTRDGERNHTRRSASSHHHRGARFSPPVESIGDESDDDGEVVTGKSGKLAALEAHGASLLEAFGLNAEDMKVTLPSGKGTKARKKPSVHAISSERNIHKRESMTAGHDGMTAPRPQQTVERPTRRSEDKAQRREASQGSESHKGVTSDTGRHAVETVVFGDINPLAVGRHIRPSSSVEIKELMSSKIRRPDQEDSRDASRAARPKRRGEAKGDGEESEAEEKELQANDRALSHLLSTTLFAPGSSFASESRLASSSSSSAGAGGGTATASARRDLSHQDTLARLLELSVPQTSSRADVAPARGWGELALKGRRLASMPSQMRAGLRKAHRASAQRRVEEAKQLGNYHPSLKRALRSSAGVGGADELVLRGASGSSRPKKRSRDGNDVGGGGGAQPPPGARQRQVGLKAQGVGRFRGGALHISKGDIERVNAMATPRRGGAASSKGRGGKSKR